MAWIKKTGADFLDMRTGMHVITLHDPDTGAEHKLQFFIGVECCPLCGKVPHKTETGHIDVNKHVEETISMLEENHVNQREHAKKHRVPIRKAKP